MDVGGWSGSVAGHGDILVERVRACRTVYNRAVNRLLRGPAARFVVPALGICAITYLYFRQVHVNPTTVGFTFLLVVLLVSAAWGLGPAVFTAVVAALAYNFFFLPPLGTFTIADPQNWVALAAFLITAIFASQLSARVRMEALSADRRRHEAERLYAFSQTLLAADNILELLNALPGRVVDALGVAHAAMFLMDGDRTYYSSLAAQAAMDPAALRATAARGEPTSGGSAAAYFVPLRIGIRPVGALGIAGGSLSRETLDAISSLIAIAIERARAVEQLGRAEAARESEKLRTALLDSVTHEFRTPLTSILASAKTLLSDDQLDENGRRELLAVINEEGERLNRLVGEAAEMAQLEAHHVELHFYPQDIHQAIEGALAECSAALKDHRVEVSVPDNLPLVRMDLKRIQEVLAHLLDNAGKYAPPGTPIAVTAEISGPHLMISVADRGPGIDSIEQGMIFEKFYRGRGQRGLQGTGMGLAIVKAIVEAHGGTVGVTSQLRNGSVFFFSLPRFPA